MGTGTRTARARDAVCHVLTFFYYFDFLDLHLYFVRFVLVILSFTLETR